MLSEQTKATLLRLADFAPTIPLEEWDLETWWCGSKGCLIGNAIAKGVLPGLKLDYEMCNGVLTHWLVPTTPTATQFGAIAEALNIPKTDVLYLFAPEEIPDEERTRPLTREEMAECIRYYVARNS